MKRQLMLVVAAALLAPGAHATDLSTTSRRKGTRFSKSAKAATRFATPPSATKLSGVTASAYISPSRAPRTAVSAPGVSPTAALAAGLKVDVDALPRSLQRALARGKVDLEDPATTLELLKLDAVVGITGIFDERGKIVSMGIQCALCHSTVDDSFAPGIGRRRDGWANRDLNVGAIIALAPRLEPVAHLLGADRRHGAHSAELLGTRAASTPCCSSTARRSGPMANRRRC